MKPALTWIPKLDKYFLKRKLQIILIKTDPKILSTIPITTSNILKRYHDQVGFITVTQSALTLKNQTM